MKNRIALPLLVAFLLLGAMFLLVTMGQAAALPTFQGEIPYPDPSEAREAAVSWLVEYHQNEDGGYSSFSGGADLAPSDAGGTVDALIALAAGEADLFGPLAYLLNNKDQLISYASLDGSTAGKTVLALTAAGEDPRDFDGEDYVIAISEQISPTGQFNVNTAFNQSLAILGLAAGEPVPEISLEWLVDQQEQEGDLAGSWDDGFGTAGNADSTAMAMGALLAARLPIDNETVAGALDFLAESQLETGGWEYGPGYGENANSTALAVTVLNLAGEDVTSGESPWLQESGTPMVALLSWQSVSGAFQADFGEGRFDDFFSTVQSAPALAEMTQVIPTPTAEPTIEPTDEPTAEPTIEPTEEPATQPPPTEEPTAEPTSTGIPESTSEPAAPSVEEEPESSGPAFAGGDSILPYLVVGAVIIIIIVFAVWYLKGRGA